ncbi:lipoprotein [Neorhizobium sp. NCHU2750]|nr:lipoprotein [Neorhizobium sp. NCHU2750]
MKTTITLRMALGTAGLLAASAALSGCMGPTYGTDKPAMVQLGDDLGAAVAIGGGKDEDKAKIRYNPRPTLVVAKQDETGHEALPAPEKSLANRDNNPNWVESPEETRARLRKEAEDNRLNQNYRSPLLAGDGTAGQLTETQKWEAFRKAKAAAETTDVSGGRHSLTDPPAAYRSADPAALADLGEPESKKEARRKKEAEAASTGSNSAWWKPFQ